MNAYTWECVLKYTNSAQDYKNFRLVCKEWDTILNRLFPDGGKFINHLWTAIKLLPDEPWNMVSVCMNINTDVYKQPYQREYIEKVGKAPLCKNRYIGNIVRNFNTTWEDYQANVEPNMYGLFLQNPNLTYVVAKQLIPKPQLYTFLGLIRDAPYEKFRKYNKTFPLHRITWDIIQKYPDDGWNFDELSVNPNITWEIIEANPGYPWNYENFTNNRNFKTELCKTHSHLFPKYKAKADLFNLVARPITPQDSLYWLFGASYEELKNIPPEFIEVASTNPDLTWRIIYTRTGWDYSNLSKNEFSKSGNSYWANFMYDHVFG